MKVTSTMRFGEQHRRSESCKRGAGNYCMLATKLLHAPRNYCVCNIANAKLKRAVFPQETCNSWSNEMQLFARCKIAPLATETTIIASGAALQLQLLSKVLLAYRPIVAHLCGDPLEAVE